VCLRQNSVRARIRRSLIAAPAMAALLELAFSFANFDSVSCLRGALHATPTRVPR
jgi:hypothetical protein